METRAWPKARTAPDPVKGLELALGLVMGYGVSLRSARILSSPAAKGEEKEDRQRE